MKKTFWKIHILSDVIIILIKSRVEKRSRLVNRKWRDISDMAHANFRSEDRYGQF